MNAKFFKRQVIDITLNAVNKQPDEWSVYNSKIYTIFLGNNYDNNRISLSSNELPILECSLRGSLFVVTTDRLISIINESYDEVYIKDVNKFLDDNELDEKYTDLISIFEIDTIVIQKNDGGNFVFMIDSNYPSFFVKILIYNMASYKQTNRWYLNPKSNWNK